MSGKRRWFAILVLASLVTATLGVPVGAGGAESSFHSKINSSRSSAGLPSLTMDSSLSSYARSHTQKMMDADQIFHSSDSALRNAAGSGWTRVGENVGRGGSVDSLHQAFMESSGHRANILGDYTHVGIGTGTKGDYLYVTVVFVKRDSSPTTTQPAPTTTQAAKSSSSSSPSTTKPTTTTTTTTTTTLPPTTTTTLIVGPDRPVTPGESCFTATRFWWMCHD